MTAILVHCFYSLLLDLKGIKNACKVRRSWFASQTLCNFAQEVLSAISPWWGSYVVRMWVLGTPHIPAVDSACLRNSAPWHVTALISDYRMLVERRLQYFSCTHAWTLLLLSRWQHYQEKMQFKHFSYACELWSNPPGPTYVISATSLMQNNAPISMSWD